MFLQLLQTDPQQYIAIVLVVIVSICLHELGHGFAAIALGDRTPEETGHITLNPFVHMGTFSLVMLAVAGISWGLMPIDVTRMRGRYAESLVALAGPAVNVVLALLGLTALGLWGRWGTIDLDDGRVANAVILLRTLGVMNVALALLNVIPTPPLDGSRVAANLIPGYRRLVSDPMLSGVMLAVTFGVLIAAGRFLFPVADDVSNRYVHWIVTVGRAPLPGATYDV